jgi:hypothetical protein
MSNTPEQTAHAVAQAFVRHITEALTPEELAQVRNRNVTNPPGCCATHDFLDANMVMDAAFAEVCGRSALSHEPDSAEEQAALAVWNTAWPIAKAQLTAGGAMRRRCMLNAEVECNVNHHGQCQCVPPGQDAQTWRAMKPDERDSWLDANRGAWTRDATPQ